MLATHTHLTHRLVGDLDVMERLMAEYEDLFLAHVVSDWCAATGLLERIVPVFVLGRLSLVCLSVYSSDWAGFQALDSTLCCSCCHHGVRSHWSV